jgi:hypothetical protein
VLTIGSPLAFIWLYRISPEFGNFFARLFRVEGIAGIEILMLPLGYTLGTIVNTLAFWIKFEKDFSHGLLLRETWRVWIGSLGAGVIGGFFAYIALNIFDSVFDLTTLRGVFLQGFVAGCIGIVVGIFVLKALGSKELEEVSETLHKKIPFATIFGKTTRPQFVTAGTSSASLSASDASDHVDTAVADVDTANIMNENEGTASAIASAEPEGVAYDTDTKQSATTDDATTDTMKDIEKTEDVLVLEPDKIEP